MRRASSYPPRCLPFRPSLPLPSPRTKQAPQPALRVHDCVHDVLGLALAVWL